MCGVVMAMFALYQAARRYAIRCLRRVFRFDPAAICLALAFVFSTAVGAMAQSITITADAGPDRTVASGATVTLDGSGSTASDGTTLYYIWIIFDDSAEHVPGFSSRSGKVQTFTAPNLEPGAADVTISFILQVRDRPGFIGGVSSGDTVTITVEAPNANPVAEAGEPQTVDSGATVQLEGSGADMGGTIATYAWTRTGGTMGGMVTFSDATIARPTFTADTLAAGADDVTHILTLTVTDNDGATHADTVTITVEAPNANPVAEAGEPQTVDSGATVQLEGSGADMGGTIATYAWTRTGGTMGGMVTFSDATIARPTFTADTLAAGADDVTHILTLTVTDNDGATHADTVTITVEAPNANPVAEAGEPQTVDSGATVQLEGSGADMGGTIATYAWTRTGGTMGGMVTFSDATIARPTFTADTLAAGADDVTHILTLTVTDNDGATHADTVTITVEAPDAVPNANPVAEAGEPQTVDSGATVQLEGSGADMGGTIATYAWTRTGGTMGGMVTFSDATIARPTFTADTLAAGADDVTHILTLTVTDNDGATHADTVTITVEAPNANPVAEAGEPQTVDSGATVQLEGSGADMGGTIATYAWTRTGGTMGGMVTFSDATIARPTFTADTLAAGADDVTHILTLTVTDNDGATHADTVTITVEAPNANPVAEAGEPQTVDSGATVQLEGSGADMGGTIATYAWTRTGGTMGGMVTFSDATIARPTFTADTLAAGADDVTHILTLTVTDNDGATHADTVTITVEAPDAVPNANPVAEAGEPQTVDSGATVQLEGSGADMGGTIATYAWTRTGGTMGGMVTFSDATIARPTFTADTLAAGADDVTHILTLTVTDNDGATHADTVTITVEAPNANPVAEAGEPQTVDSGATVQLEGSGADMGGTIATYAWTRTGGTMGGMVTFSDATIARPTFTADTLAAGADDVTHILTLTVTDNDGATHADTVTITVEAPNANPVAEAGEPQTVDSGATVQLEGSGADMGGTIATYAWTRTGGTMGGMVTFSDATIARPTFTADTLAAGADDVTHILTLTVTDNDGATHADTVTITVEAPNANPVAEAGEPQTVDSGATVQLEGSGADMGGTIATYAWTRTGGTMGGMVTFSDATIARPTFTADTLAAGADDVTHILTLTVTDNDGATHADTVTITVEAPDAVPNANPVAEAGEPQTVDSGATVQLEGSGADMGGTIATYAWTRTGGTMGGMVTFSDATIARPTFTADTLAAGADDVTHILTLTVTDNDGATHADTVTITVEAPNANPVAEAGEPQTVDSGATVQLEGSGADMGGTIATYAWTRTGGTMGGMVTFSDATIARPTFTADTLAAGADDVTHILTLTVTDNDGATHADTVTITVEAPNANPVAEAGEPQTVDSGATVQLEGSGADMGGTIATYAWTRTGGTMGGMVTFSDATIARPTFTADTLAAGADDVTHILTLTVTDNDGATHADTVTITVEAPDAVSNADPVAMIAGGNRSVASGTAVQLDGSGSTHDSRTTVTYGWERTGGTMGGSVPLTGEDTARLSFTADTLADGAEDVIHEFTLTVTDSEGGTDTATVTITVTSGFAAPVANAGPDQRAVSRATVRLDGTGSIPDRRKTITSYAWERTGGTGDSNLTLTGANTAQPTFTADTLNPGVDAVTHVFTLTVTDEDGMTSTDTVTVTVVSVDLRLSQSEIMVQEGGSGTYQVKLSESPLREVTIMAVSGNEDIVKLNNARLVFDGGNWNEWQEVEINSVAGSNMNDPVVIRHRLVTEGATSPVPGDVTVTLRPRADDPIPRPVGQFLQTRATALINNQPGLSSLLELDGPTPGGSFTFRATDGQLALNGGFIHNGVWGKVSGAYASSESAAGNTKSVTKSVLASFGVHRKYSEHFLAGVMLQLDLSDHERAGQVGTTDTIDGTGWLAGPYFAARHGSQPLNFEGRLLYGQSDNDIRFMDTGLGVMRTGSFDTRRLLAQIRVEGEIAMSGRNHGDDGGEEGPRLRPYADLRWIEDRANAFTDNVNNRVPGQKVSTGQLELGSNIEIPIAVRTGEMTFTGGLGLVYSNTEGDYIPSDSRGRGRGEIGFSYDLDDNLRIDLDSFYDGIGTSRYEGYGLSLSAEMKF